MTLFKFFILYTDGFYQGKYVIQMEPKKFPYSALKHTNPGHHQNSFQIFV